MLAKSRLEDKGKDLQEKIKALENQNEEFLLDVPFTAEVSRGVARLKKRKALGTDGLMDEHLNGG